MEEDREVSSTIEHGQDEIVLKLDVGELLVIIRTLCSKKSS